MPHSLGGGGLPRLSARIRTVLTGVVIVSVFVAFYVLIHDPASRRLGELRQELMVQEERLAHARGATEEVSRLEAEVVELRAVSAEVEEQIPVAPRIGELLQYVDRAQRLAGVRIVVLELGSGEPAEQYVRYPIHFQVEGGFPGQAQFLSLVEEMARLAFVGGLRMEAIDERVQPGQVRAHYVLYVFVDERREPTAADLEDLVFGRRPGRVNPFLPPSP